MERDIDFAFEGVCGVEEDLLMSLKDIISDIYNSEEDSKIDKICEELKELGLDDTNVGKIKANIEKETKKQTEAAQPQNDDENQDDEDQDDDKDSAKEDPKKGKKKKNRKGPGGKKNKAKNTKVKEEAKKVKTNDDELLETMDVFVGRKKEGIDNSRDIMVEGINIAFGNVFLLDNAKLTLNWGVRYGLIGRNG
mmetsp:Transcript_32732/g.37392  ORF Transcript_32732/g.37392 Transcript_32732/m.37392 type:complete len:194 (-) Transcript_32732:1116-1697(-)